VPIVLVRLCGLIHVGVVRAFHALKADMSSTESIGNEMLCSLVRMPFFQYERVRLGWIAVVAVSAKMSERIIIEHRHHRTHEAQKGALRRRFGGSD